MSFTRMMSVDQKKLEQLLKQLKSMGDSGSSEDIAKAIEELHKMERGLIKAKGKAEKREK